MYVDSHCHLSFPELHDRVPELRREMAATGVDRALCICTTLEEFERVHALALAHDNFWCTVGVHPDNEGVREPGVEDLVARAHLPRVVAIGETGLDYYQMAERKGGRSIADMGWQRELQHAGALRGEFVADLDVHGGFRKKAIKPWSLEPGAPN